MSPDRDRIVDELLRAALSGRKAEGAAAGDCLDAETAAVWAEGRISDAERSRYAAHAAQCARCQMLIATIVRTTPPPVVHEPWWRLSRTGWLVSLSGAAAAVVLWTMVPDMRPNVRIVEAPTVSRDSVSPPPATSPASPQVTQEATQSAQGRERAVSAPSSRADRNEPSRDAPAFADQFKKDSEPLAKKAEVDTRARAEAAEAAKESRASADMLAALSLSRQSRTADVISSDSRVRWRPAPGGGISRSADGGATWEPLTSGVTANLVAGSSPSPSVCWIVGDAGTVLLSTDGRQWRRVISPAVVDIVAVQASDARSAVVTAADGRTFRTTDAGQTWR